MTRWGTSRVPVGLLILSSFLALSQGCAHQRATIKQGFAAMNPALYLLPSRTSRPTRAPVIPVEPQPAPTLAEPAPECTQPEGWPIANASSQVISNFGVRRPSGGKGTRTHQGIDIKAAYGADVIAMADGQVSLSGTQSGYGNIVVIDHGNNISTAYAHLSSRSVQKGEKVKKGDLLGHVGRTGRATTPHLHYEVRINNKAVEPLPYLKR